MNNQSRRDLIIEHLRDARARLDRGSVPRRRQAERHVRYWSDQLDQAKDSRPSAGPPERPAPAT